MAEPAISLPENHFSICKPASPDAQIHRSVVAFIEELLQEDGQKLDANVYVDALPVSETRLAVAVHGLDDTGVPTSSVVASACVVTDNGSVLAQAIDEVRSGLQRSTLLPVTARQRMKGASLLEMATDRTLRAPLLDGLATLSFSAYVYYADADALRHLDNRDIDQRLRQQPLVHRLRKKSEHVHAAFGHGKEWASVVGSAFDKVKAETDSALRPIETLGAENRGDRLLLELAELMAAVVSSHLGDRADEDAATAFGHLWTRIRYGQNVLTNERHTRAKNPLR